MAEQYIYTMLGLNKHYGQKQVLKDIYLSFYPGAKIGIVGGNGAGKSTVLRIMSGLDQNFTGRAEISKGYTSGIVQQDPQLDPDKNVKQILEEAFGETMKLMAEYDAVTTKLGESLSDDEMQKTMDRMGELQDKLDAVDAWNLDQKLKFAADALCLPEDDRIVKTLSGGERRRVALCKELLRRPDLLLLDEPTNHLDAETINWLEMQLREYPGTVIVVTHDRYFLDNITKWILELDQGAGVPWEGSYSSWLEQKLAKMAAQDKAENKRGSALQRELAWIRMSNKDKHDLSRTRLIQYEQLVAKEASGKDEDAALPIAPGPALGDQVIEFRNVSKGFNGSPLFENLSFMIPKAGVVGIVGPNGIGKTTLFNLITGDEKPDAGEVLIGSSVQISHVDQSRANADDARTLIEEIGEGREEIAIGKRNIPIRTYLAMFDFKGSDQQKKMSQLSGGEHNRAYLAKILKTGGNVILLDEPTNDLDVSTLRLLEEGIQKFSGCVLVISHDRFFLDRVCTHVLVFEGKGIVRFFTGNFSEYEAWREKEMGSKLFENRRSRYRKVVAA